VFPVGYERKSLFKRLSTATALLLRYDSLQRILVTDDSMLFLIEN
jgi:hypothetical protein